MNEFIAGTIGGFAGKLLDYPFDTVKVLLQTQNVDATTQEVDELRVTVFLVPRIETDARKKWGCHSLHCTGPSP